jgi:hypothetical protein
VAVNIDPQAAAEFEPGFAVSCHEIERSFSSLDVPGRARYGPVGPRVNLYYIANALKKQTRRKRAGRTPGAGALGALAKEAKVCYYSILILKMLF